MGRYRKRSIIIEALQFNGENFKECEKFIEGNYDNTLNYPNIKTLEGTMRVSVGDYIIKGIHGEFYPCKPDIFVKTYDPIKDDVGIVLGTEPTAEEMLAESAQIQQDFEDLYGNS